MKILFKGPRGSTGGEYGSLQNRNKSPIMTSKIDRLLYHLSRHPTTVGFRGQECEEEHKQQTKSVMEQSAVS